MPAKGTESTPLTLWSFSISWFRTHSINSVPFAGITRTCHNFNPFLFLSVSFQLRHLILKVSMARMTHAQPLTKAKRRAPYASSPFFQHFAQIWDNVCLCHSNSNITPLGTANMWDNCSRDCMYVRPPSYTSNTLRNKHATAYLTSGN